MVSPLREAADEFLSCERIAVAGVSRSSGEAANAIYRKLKSEGHTVFPVNPSAEEVEGDPCYPDLASIPDRIEAVVVATHPSVTPDVVRECADLGISRVWMHRSFGTGSVSEEAVRLCRERGIAVIPGACPMMFCKTADVGHRCMRWWLGVRGRLPTPEE